jgi:Ca-activated chloride channel homolog
MYTNKLVAFGMAILVCLTACNNQSQKAVTSCDVVSIVSVEPTLSNDISSDSVNNQVKNQVENIVENKFETVTQQPLSTFSIDVDKAAYSFIRSYLQQGIMPPKAAVRIEELINYFDYDYEAPINDDAFAIHSTLTSCPWNTQHQLVHIGIKGKEIKNNQLQAANFVFLVDVSGSMADENKLPLLKQSLKLLVQKLSEQDKVSIITYAGNESIALPPTACSNKEVIITAINHLESGGATAGEAGIKLAYTLAKQNFSPQKNNRIILATDGDFNVGISSQEELVSLIEKERNTGIFLTVLGFGMGNYQDEKMQELADRGNGNHAYIDNINEAQKVLVDEFTGTLFTIAKDVKIQIEFNPSLVQSYRLIGYENRILAKEDFNNDKKDAGELGAGHTVTAIYEVIPIGVKDEFTNSVDKLKYQVQSKENSVIPSDELLTIKLRYKQPLGNTSALVQQSVKTGATDINKASKNVQYATAVAGFGMLLKNSTYKQSINYEDVLHLAKQSIGTDEFGYRNEFIQLVKKAASFSVAVK